MRCRDVDALASAYIDGELDDARASALRGHARTCERCARCVEDLVILRDEAASLEAIDPPADLWPHIEAGLARAEIADSHRSRLWLRWQAIRPMILPGAVAVTAAAVLLVWLVRPGQKTRTAEPSVKLAVQAENLAAASAAGSSEDMASAQDTQPGQEGDDFFAARAAEVGAADARYRATLDELHALVTSERASWPRELGVVFDRRLASLASMERRHRDALAGKDSLASHDELHAVYRAEIEFLQAVVVDGVVEAGGELAPDSEPASHAAGILTGGVAP